MEMDLAGWCNPNPVYSLLTLSQFIVQLLFLTMERAMHEILSDNIFGIANLPIGVNVKLAFSKDRPNFAPLPGSALLSRMPFTCWDYASKNPGASANSFSKALEISESAYLCCEKEVSFKERKMLRCKCRTTGKKLIYNQENFREHAYLDDSINNFGPGI
jgi:hypothetical protein